jgi:hypothetical protein
MSSLSTSSTSTSTASETSESKACIQLRVARLEAENLRLRQQCQELRTKHAVLSNNTRKAAREFEDMLALYGD